jgi:hypothetical protein
MNQPPLETGDSTDFFSRFSQGCVNCFFHAADLPQILGFLRVCSSTLDDPILGDAEPGIEPTGPRLTLCSLLLIMERGDSGHSLSLTSSYITRFQTIKS